MARDPLKVLWRVRDGAVMAASRDLAAAREVEAQHVARHAAHCMAMRREQDAATGPLVAAFIEWLPHARRQADGLHRAVQREQARVAGLQRALVVRRTEAEAVSKAISRNEAAAGQVTARKEQAAMDEAAGRSGALRFA